MNQADWETTVLERKRNETSACNYTMRRFALERAQVEQDVKNGDIDARCLLWSHVHAKEMNHELFAKILTQKLLFIDVDPGWGVDPWPVMESLALTEQGETYKLPPGLAVNAQGPLYTIDTHETRMLTNGKCVMVEAVFVYFGTAVIDLMLLMAHDSYREKALVVFAEIIFRNVEETKKRPHATFNHVENKRTFVRVPTSVKLKYTGQHVDPKVIKYQLYQPYNEITDRSITQKNTLEMTNAKKNGKHENFVDLMVADFEKHRETIDASTVVTKFMDYFETLYKQDKANQKKRKLSFLSSVQSRLSKYKQRIRKLGASKAYLRGIKMTHASYWQLVREKNETVRQNAIHLPTLSGDAMITKCNTLLQSDDFNQVIIGLAGLTGRRMSELLFSMKFNEPVEKHSTSSEYWCAVSGILKQRGQNKQRVIEVPFLQKRRLIIEKINALRLAWPATSIAEVNKKYAKRVSRAVKKHCPEISHLHQFRKLYVFLCEKYFNENGCSQPRIASDYLGHNNMNATVLTYLNFRVDDIGSFKFKPDNDASRKKQKIK